jgi:hydrophobic/amphiphilic exporter-1 (mainly G- bacteria), HAE1 family
VPHHARKEPRFFLTRFINWLANGFNRAFDATSNAYGRTIRLLTGGVVGLGVMLLVYAGVIAGTLHLAQTTPTGFIPDQDQGYLIGVVQLPSGASLDRTTEVILRAAQEARKVDGVANAVIIAGFDGATFTNTTNAGVMFLTLKNAKDRAEAGRSAGVITGDVLKATANIQEARVIVVPPPPVRGLGNGGGFKMQIESRQSSDIGPLMAAAGEVIAQANQSADVTRVFTTFDNSTPQLFLDIDRTIARMLNVPLANVFSSVQADLGGTYVNDFNTLGRIYQVRLQGDAAFRTSTQDISQIKVRSSTGALVPMGTLASVRDVTGPQIVQRFNLYYSVPVQGVAKPGVSTGQALDSMEAIAKKALPEGYSYDWTEIAYQQKAASGTGAYVFALGVLLVFLVLAAQYESWALPLAILLVVPTGVLAALAGVQFRGQDNNILTQIGLIVLIGLAAKNAILIVEFAHDIELRERRGPVEAAVEACRLRLRPILMTAFAFILGTLPLVVATGPGAEMRQALGTAVFFGMIGATFFGLFLTPVFYVVIRHLSIWLGRFRKKHTHGGDHGGAAPAHG